MNSNLHAPRQARNHGVGMTNPDSREALAAALQAVIEERAEAAADERRRGDRRRGDRRRGDRRGSPGQRAQWPFVLVMLLSLGATAWIWLARPAVIFGTLDRPPRSAEVEAATLRFALFLEHARVREYIAVHGRPPSTLAAAGPVEEGVTLEAAGGRWLVRGDAGGVTLRLTDRMDADSFLGNAIQVLRADQ
jgi:hypothetical protein